ncbi:MAG TPA: M48 family metallopeptidase [Terriglobales bacterium]|nr:M48 family metallopeptidase [Terriglobales bacterium]
MKSRALALIAALLLSLTGFAQDTPPASQTPAPAPQAQAPAPTGDTQAQAPVAGAPEAQPADAQAVPASADDQNAKKDDKDTKKKEKDAKKQDKDEIKHDGGKDDVSAIGNRKMGGKGLGNWYSLEKEIAMGKGYAQQIESSVKLVQDPVVVEYVNRVGQNLVRNSDAKVPFTIKVIDTDEINAMALPGGFFYVNSGLILAADDEAELAGVMAHEIAHVAARHATRQMTRGQIANLATIPLIFMGGGLGYAIQSAAGFALPMTFLTFSRGFEAEADYLGLQYMYATGYDPNAFVSFFEKLEAKEKKKPGTLAKAFSTHPMTPDRITKTQEEIQKILPAKAQYVVDTSEFQDVKARLAALENRHKINNDQSSDRPTLRRTTSNDSAKGKDGKDDDRPTLKKRPDQQQ